MKTQQKRRSRLMETKNLHQICAKGTRQIPNQQRPVSFSVKQKSFPLQTWEICKMVQQWHLQENEKVTDLNTKLETDNCLGGWLKRIVSILKYTSPPIIYRVFCIFYFNLFSITASSQTGLSELSARTNSGRCTHYTQQSLIIFHSQKLKSTIICLWILFVARRIQRQIIARSSKDIAKSKDMGFGCNILKTGLRTKAMSILQNELLMHSFNSVIY